MDLSHPSPNRENLPFHIAKTAVRCTFAVQLTIVAKKMKVSDKISQSKPVTPPPQNMLNLRPCNHFSIFSFFVAYSSL